MSSRQEKVLALAVSLWIAGGGFASAQDTVVTENYDGNIYGNHPANGSWSSSDDSNTSGNTVTIEVSATVAKTDENAEVCGASAVSTNLSENSVTVRGTVKGDVCGACLQAQNEYVENNTVIIESGGEVTGDVYGGKKGGAVGGYVSYNMVKMTGGKVGWSVYGGSANGNAEGNEVHVTAGSQVKQVTGGNVYGGSNNYFARKNKVYITDSQVNASVMGGSASSNFGHAATGNEVFIKNSQIGGDVLGGISRNVNATGNKVSLSGATIGGAVYGGKVTHPESGVNCDAVTGNILTLAGANTVGGAVQNFEMVALSSDLVWNTETPVLAAEAFTNYGTLDITAAAKFKESASGTMILLQSNTANDFANLSLKYSDGTATLTADNDTVEVYRAALSAQDSGVTLDYNTLHTVSINLDGLNTYQNVTYNVASKASKLTFGNVEWKDTGALIDHTAKWSGISFEGADVDTTKIHFTNIQSLEANKKMTLVSSFGNTVGTITGTEYTVGTTLYGKGQASLSGEDLIYTVETTAQSKAAITAQAQTHSTLMGMEAGLGALTAGTESIGEAMTGLASSANTGSDGVAVYAGMGGGTARQKTGSHVDSHNWNAILALGTKNETSKGSIEWGGFFEYGRGNFTTHSDAGRADGTASYTGGGLLAKWTTPQDIYVEGSFRAGRTHDTARDMLHDVLGNSYGYNVHANYVGGHIGVGKIFRLDEGRNIDVYGKFFYNRRGGVSFNAGGQYDLDAVESKILRTGFKYNADISKGWNWYAGLAYEYEFDGKSTGTADGAPIRAASIKGGSVLGEVGLHLSATETNPWEADLNLHGSCGQHRGVGGTVSVAYKF